MHKVVALYLAGRTYHVEEDGYEVLRAYLEAVSAARRDSNGSGAIDDIETKVADKCDAALIPPKTVVSSREMDEIVRAVSIETRTGAFAAHEQQSPPRRFYLIREHSLVGGVCTGLAAYFNIDVLLIRLIFLILTVITGGGWILAYFAMMVMIPYAHTQEEHARAHGHFWSTETLPRDVKEVHARTEARREKRRTLQSNISSWRREIWCRMRIETPLLASTVPLFGSLLTLAWIFALLSLIATGTIFGWQLPNVPLWLAIVLLFFIYWAFINPLRNFHIRTYLFSREPRLLEDLLLFTGLIAGIWLLYTYVPPIHSFLDAFLEAVRQVLMMLETAVA